MKKVFVILSCLLINACVSLKSVSTSSIPSQRSKPVSTESSKFIFLGFNFSNDYVDLVVQNLANKCPNGKIEGLLTKQESIEYFFFIFWSSKVTASGYCVNNSLALNTNPRKPNSEQENISE